MLPGACVNGVCQGGDKIPRKGGPGISQSDLLVINKVSLISFHSRQNDDANLFAPPRSTSPRTSVPPWKSWTATQSSCVAMALPSSPVSSKTRALMMSSRSSSLPGGRLEALGYLALSATLSKVDWYQLKENRVQRIVKR